MADRFAPGTRVRTLNVDPAHHTRLPRYARGRSGVVVECAGRHPLPDRLVRGLPAPSEPIYAVRFSAVELWGTGHHSVTVDLWETYLEEDR